MSLESKICLLNLRLASAGQRVLFVGRLAVSDVSGTGFMSGASGQLLGCLGSSEAREPIQGKEEGCVWLGEVSFPAMSGFENESCTYVHTSSTLMACSTPFNPKAN